MANLKYGSSGNDVTDLQNRLRAAGYNIVADGQYGSETAAAVKAYQQANGLSVDGVAGSQTLGSLGGRTGGNGIDYTYIRPDSAILKNAANTYGTGKEQAAAEEQEYVPNTQTSPFGAEYDANKVAETAANLKKAEGAAPTFQQSQGLTDALNKLQKYLNAGKPGEYQSGYQDKIAELYEKAVNGREPFAYDPNADPLYQMYRDRYAQSARQSMQDTMANAAALSGGYGNSYGAAAGQQAYDAQMAGLNDALPQLYQQAYGRWQDEGNDLLQRLALAREMDATDYARYQDRLADYYNQMSAQRALAGDMYDREWQGYAAQLAQYNQDRDYYNQKAQQEMARMQALREAGYITGDQYKAWLSQMGYIPEYQAPAQSGGMMMPTYYDGGTAANLTDYDDYMADGILDGRGYNGEKLTGGSWYREHPEEQKSGSSGKKSSSAAGSGTGGSSSAVDKYGKEIDGMTDYNAYAYVKELAEKGNVTGSQATKLLENAGIDPARMAAYDALTAAATNASWNNQKEYEKSNRYSNKY